MTDEKPGTRPLSWNSSSEQSHNPARPRRDPRRSTPANGGEGLRSPVPKEHSSSDYQPIDSYALIGNLRTSASVALKDTSIDFLCWPHFDSPSIFLRLLDTNVGGHWSIAPRVDNVRVKQSYMPNSCVLRTKYLCEEGVVNVLDWMPRPRPGSDKPLVPWLIRRVEGIRGKVRVRLECFPAFNYARDSHSTELCQGSDGTEGGAIFQSKDLELELLVVTATIGDLQLYDGQAEAKAPLVIDSDSFPRQKGPGIVSDFLIEEGQVVTFVLRTLPGKDEPVTPVTAELCDTLLNSTNAYWAAWIHKTNYKGRWREYVQRSCFTLKLLIFEPTGAICAAPTFSLPESIGGTRQWDYRFTWVRDASFTLYALIRLGLTDEAAAYMRFIWARILERKPGHHLQIMYRLDGGHEMTEETLDHLEGYKQSRPVRIGNGAAGHVQLDIYGELLDAVYLYQKFGRPLSYDMWRDIRNLVQFVAESYDRTDSSIWEVRSQEQNYLYSKIMVWVCLDRGLRLADKRSLPCPNRLQWLETRDKLYEEIQEKGWNAKEEHFCQSYESPDVLDSSCLIMPLVFFCDAGDPRFLSTLHRILRTPERGGLTANSLVFRCGSPLTLVQDLPEPRTDDVQKAQDGIEEGGEEGSFNMCVLSLDFRSVFTPAKVHSMGDRGRLVEEICVHFSTQNAQAMARAGKYDASLLQRARQMFQDFVDYSSHVGLYSEGKPQECFLESR